MDFTKFHKQMLKIFFKASLKEFLSNTRRYSFCRNVWEIRGGTLSDSPEGIPN